MVRNATTNAGVRKGPTVVRFASTLTHTMKNEQRTFLVPCGDIACRSVRFGNVGGHFQVACGEGDDGWVLLNEELVVAEPLWSATDSNRNRSKSKEEQNKR